MNKVLMQNINIQQNLTQTVEYQSMVAGYNL
mgnify:CR=1 FL=1